MLVPLPLICLVLTHARCLQSFGLVFFHATLVCHLKRPLASMNDQIYSCTYPMLRTVVASYLHQRPSFSSTVSDLHIILRRVIQIACLYHARMFPPHHYAV